MTAADEWSVPVDLTVIRAEQNVLGATMLSANAAQKVVSELTPEHYLRPAHASIHRAVKALLAAGEPVTALTVADRLNAAIALPEAREGRRRTLLDVVGGAVYLHTLIESVPTVEQTGYAIGLVVTANKRRRIIETFINAAQRAAETDVDLDDLARDVRTDIGWLVWRPDSSWPTPMPLSARLPEFPLDALPGTVGRIVRATAEATQTAPDLAAMAVLATLSAATRGAWEIVARPGWIEQTSIYAVGLANSGERKSAVMSAIAGALAATEKHVQEHGAEDHATDAMAYRVLERRAKAAEDHAARAGHGVELDDAIAEAQKLATQLATSAPPAAFRLLVDDTTPEKLAMLMASQGGPMAVLSAEGGLLGTIAGRYADAANVDLVLKSYDGERVSVDRVSRDSLLIERPFLALGLIVQPDVIAEAVKVRAFTERGLLPRMLFALPRTMLGVRELDSTPIAPETATEWSNVVAGILHAGRAALGPKGQPARLYLDAEATAALDEFRHAHELRLHPDSGDLTDVLAWASKLPGALVRIAALLALSRTAAGERSIEGNPYVSGEEMRAALTLAPYLIAHAREVLAGGGGERGRLASVLKWVRARGQDGETRPSGPEVVTFSERDAWRALRGQAWAETSAHVAQTLSDLADLGYLRRMDPPAPAKRGGRPPGVSYEVNPRIRELRRGR